MTRTELNRQLSEAGWEVVKDGHRATVWRRKGDTRPDAPTIAVPVGPWVPASEAGRYLRRANRVDRR